MSKWHGLVSMMNSLSAVVYRKITKIKQLQYDDSAILFLKVLIPRLTTLTESEIFLKKEKVFGKSLVFMLLYVPVYGKLSHEMANLFIEQMLRLIRDYAFWISLYVMWGIMFMHQNT